MKRIFSLLCGILVILGIQASAEDMPKFVGPESLENMIIAEIDDNSYSRVSFSRNSEDNARFFEELNKLISEGDISKIDLKKVDMHFMISWSEHEYMYINSAGYENDKTAVITAKMTEDSSFVFTAPWTQTEELIDSFMNEHVLKFDDVDEDDENLPIYTAFAFRGRLNVYEDNTLRLHEKVTRAEFLTMLIDEPVIISDNDDFVQTFEDVPPEHFAYGYIEAAYQKGIIKGMGNGRFEPDSPIKLEDICVIVAKDNKLIGEDGLSVYRERRQLDNVSDYARESVNALMVNATVSDTDNVQNYASRKDAVLVIYFGLQNCKNAKRRICIDYPEGEYDEDILSLLEWYDARFMR